MKMKLRYSCIWTRLKTCTHIIFNYEFDADRLQYFVSDRKFTLHKLYGYHDKCIARYDMKLSQLTLRLI